VCRISVRWLSPSQTPLGTSEDKSKLDQTSHCNPNNVREQPRKLLICADRGHHGPATGIVPNVIFAATHCRGFAGHGFADPKPLGPMPLAEHFRGPPQHPRRAPTPQRKCSQWHWSIFGRFSRRNTSPMRLSPPFSPRLQWPTICNHHKTDEREKGMREEVPHSLTVRTTQSDLACQ